MRSIVKAEVLNFQEDKAFSMHQVLKNVSLLFLPYSLLLRAILMNRCDIILSGENVDKDRRYSRQVVDSRVAFIYTQVDAF